MSEVYNLNLHASPSNHYSIVSRGGKDYRGAEDRCHQEGKEDHGQAGHGEAKAKTWEEIRELSRSAGGSRQGPHPLIFLLMYNFNKIWFLPRVLKEKLPCENILKMSVRGKNSILILLTWGCVLLLTIKQMCTWSLINQNFGGNFFLIWKDFSLKFEIGKYFWNT